MFIKSEFNKVHGTRIVAKITTLKIIFEHPLKITYIYLYIINNFMKKIYSVILLSALFYSVSLYAQESKMSISLYRYVNNPSHNSTRSAENIPVLVKGDVAKIRSYTLSHGGVFKYSVANKFASIILPVSTIQDFSQTSFVARVEGIYSLPKPMDDSVGCHQSYVFPVHNDSTPLTRGYLGDSVIVGIVDGGGFYFRHKDFRQPYDTTKTRFLYIWSQTDPAGPPPANFDYGTEWDSAAINSGQCAEGDNEDDFSHGTNCLGVATGNGQTVSPSLAYISPAPKADIIGVKFIYDQNWLTYVVDGANYIYSKADALHEPCVITFSYGTYVGSHDGQDLVTQMLDSLITEHSGHAFVAACGDGGGYPFHLGYTATPDSQFTWFFPANGGESFEFWIDTTNAGNFNFTVGIDNPANWQYLGRDIFLNIDSFLKYHANEYAGGIENSKGKILFHDTLLVEQQGNAYHFVYYIGTDSTNYYIRFITRGSGRFDLWSTPGYTNTWEMISHVYQQYLPTVSQDPDFASYVYSDSIQTICSGIQCSPNVISVANYINRNNWVECSGATYSNLGITPGSLSASSSWGPTRDGRIEPDITAPGDETLAPGDSLIDAIEEGNSNAYKVAKGCVYNLNGGTSMAAPFAAGVTALYLQKYPTATWKEVKAAIDSCAYKDSFTGATPASYEWGYGKIDAYCMIQHPEADTTVIPSGIERLASNKVLLNNYPNPFNNYTTIVYSLGNSGFQSAEIDVYNMIGQKISVMPLHSSSGSIQFNNNNLPQGMYIYRLIVDQKPFAISKFIILY
jgi:subtilisin family serine protease